jgi:transposase
MAVAKTRKRCPWCRKMIEAGTEVTVTDDRRVVERPRHFVPGSGNYVRGAVHLYHPECRSAEQQAFRDAEARSQRDRQAETDELRKLADSLRA